jgi:hypothetical protein
MANTDMLRIAGNRVEEQMSRTVTISNGKTYYLDTIAKRLRNVDNYFDSIDIEHMLKGREGRVQPKLIVRDDSIILDCKCGKMLFVNPEWKRVYRTPYAIEKEVGDADYPRALLNK